MDWPFSPLTPMKYGVIYADPPWAYEMRSEKETQTRQLEEHRKCNGKHLEEVADAKKRGSRN